MTRAELRQHMEACLELAPGTVKDEANLADLPNWDSMAPLAIMAMADMKLGKNLSGKDIQQCKTVSDLIRLFGDLNAE